jgi:predicted nucleotide-binding protein
MPTVWNHFEGAFAVAMRKELLVITEEHVAIDGITWDGGGEIVVTAPADAYPEWLDDSYASHQIGAWIDAVMDVRDVFLAYSTKARATANDIQKYVKSRGYTLMDWELDFAAGGTILEALNDATEKCIGGITLLTKDDDLIAGDQYHAAPRDNVIFELGLFVQNTGHKRVLVIREDGTKMPADLGGSIYLPLKDRNDITPIHSKIEKFLESRL